MTPPPPWSADDGFVSLAAPGGGAIAVFNTYGARLVALRVPDRDGTPTDVVLGFATRADYEADPSYQGAIVGRYANRIAGAAFRLADRHYRLIPNEGPNLLHGGPTGFSRQAWTIRDHAPDRVVFALRSPDGDGGFPGTLDVEVTYRLEAPARLTIAYAARSDADTVLNLTNHAYFNLAGEGRGPIDDHVLQIAAGAITEVDRALIPTGRLVAVAGTPFDLRTPQAIAAALAPGHPQLAHTGGYDHNFVLDGGVTDAPRVVARLKSPATGIILTVETTEPGLQIYGSHHLDIARPSKSGGRYGPRAGLCLETQHFPDSPNQPTFPSTRLAAGAMYRTTTVYDLTTEP